MERIPTGRLRCRSYRMVRPPLCRHRHLVPAADRVVGPRQGNPGQQPFTPLGLVTRRPVAPHRAPDHLPALGTTRGKPYRSVPAALTPPGRRNPSPQPDSRSRDWSWPTPSGVNFLAASARPGGSRAKSWWPKASPTGFFGHCANANGNRKAPRASVSSREPGPHRSPAASPPAPAWSSAPTTTRPAFAAAIRPVTRFVAAERKRVIRAFVENLTVDGISGSGELRAKRIPDALNIGDSFKVVAGTGFEPVTFGL